MSVYNIETSFANFLIQNLGLIFGQQTADPALGDTSIAAVWYRSDLNKLRMQDNTGGVHNIATEDLAVATALPLVGGATIGSGMTLAVDGSLVGADETLATATPAVSLAKRTTRFDLATLANNIAATLANGAYIGQRKSLVNMSASSAKATTITPATMAEALNHVTLTARWDACELEWQVSGWKVVHLNGTAAVA